MKARTTINWAMASALAILLGIVGLWGYERYKVQEADGWAEHSHQVIQRLEELLSALKDVETGQRGFLIAGDPAYLEPYNEALGSVERELASLRALTRDNARQQERWKALEPLIRAKLAELKQTIEARAAQGFEPARAIVMAGRGKGLMDQIRRLVAEAKRDEAGLLQDRRIAKEASLVHSFWIALVGAVLSGSLLLTAFILLMREIKARTQAEKELRQHRDHLEKRVEERTREISHQSATLQQQGAELARQNEELQGQAEELEHQAEELQSQTEELRAANQESDRREAMLQTILSSLHGVKDERQVLSRVCQALMELAGESAAAAGVVEQVGEQLVVRATAGFEKPWREQWPVENSFAALVMAEGKTGFVEDLTARPDIVLPEPHEGKFRSLLATPLRVNGTPIGALELYALRPRQWTRHDFQVIEWAGTQCAQALEAVRLQTELRESNERFKKVLEVEAVGVLFWDLTTGCLVDANDAFLNLMGYTRQDVEARELTWEKLTLPEYREASRAEIRKFQATGRVGPYEKEYLRKDGTRQWLVFAGSALGPNSCVEFCVDISARKKAEAALRESERRRGEAQRIARVGNWEWNLRTGQVRWSPEIYAMSGLNPDEPGLNPDALLELVHPEDLEQVRTAIAQTIADGTPADLDYRIVRPDGSVRVIHAMGAVTERDAEGRPSLMLGTNQDITERKQAEEQVRTALQEKEVMLREIHHRVKNNLQVIASLVDLQTNTLEDPAVLGIFADIRGRVRSMALVHEKLYQSESLARVDFGEYMQSLLGYLARAHNKPGSSIALKTDLQPVQLSLDKAVPCGLIINELVSNAYKHAFPGRAEGEIRAALALDPDGRVRVRVADSGVGLPAGEDWRTRSSLGLRLVQLLSGQLNATLEARTEAGTDFQITFEPERPASRA